MTTTQDPTRTPAIGDLATVTDHHDATLTYEAQVVNVKASLLTGQPVAVLCRTDMLAQFPHHKGGEALAFDSPRIVWHDRPTDLDEAVANAHDEEDLTAAGFVACWIGVAADRWAATLDQAIAASTSTADLADFGYTIDHA